MAYAHHLAEASGKYLPASIKLLFVAEAPPLLKSGRFFYLTSLTTGDTLFIEMMKVLYPTDAAFVEGNRKPDFDAKRVRQRKQEFLEKFKHDGFYLIDASEQSMPEDANPATKRQMLRNALPELKKKALNLCSERDVPIILIGNLTYSVCAAPLREDRLRILNDAPIDHPARGGQKRFRRKLHEVIRKFALETSDGHRTPRPATTKT